MGSRAAHETRQPHRVVAREITVPLTEFQRTILALLAETRSPDSYLAGGTALHFSPNSTRYSKDLDFFHDSAERVASAYAEDSARLQARGCVGPSFVRVARLRLPSPAPLAGPFVLRTWPDAAKGAGTLKRFIRTQ